MTLQRGSHMVGVWSHTGDFPLGAMASRVRSSKVLAIVREKEALVWSAEDAVWLREEWRIVGSLVGSLASHPRQNLQLGLPLSLSPDEATLLTEYGVVELCTYEPPTPTEEDGEKFSELRENDFRVQEERYRQQRERTRREHGGRMPSKRPRMETEEEGQSVTGLSSFSPLVCIHTVDPNPGNCSPAHWTYPTTLMEGARYRVFRDLWREGKYVTSGAKYGGDFLVYSGDPCLVHSDYIAVVLPWQQPISSLVALGHLGSKVRKNVLLCSVSPDSDTVTYFSLQWGRM